MAEILLDFSGSANGGLLSCAPRSKSLCRFATALLLTTLFAPTAAALAADRVWDARIDLAELRLDGEKTFVFESAIFHSLPIGRLHLELDGRGARLSRVTGIQIQMLYERPLNDRIVLWGGAEHDFATSDHLNLLDVGGGVQWTREFYTETSTFISSSGKVYQQLKFVASAPLNSNLILEPRGELNGAFQSNHEQGLIAGPTDLSLSIRLRMRRDHGLAPYAGMCWSNVLGGTARLAHRNGQSIQSIAALFGAGWSF